MSGYPLSHLKGRRGRAPPHLSRVEALVRRRHRIQRRRRHHDRRLAHSRKLRGQRMHERVSASDLHTLALKVRQPQNASSTAIARHSPACTTVALLASHSAGAGGTGTRRQALAPPPSPRLAPPVRRRSTAHGARTAVRSHTSRTTACAQATHVAPWLQRSAPHATGRTAGMGRYAGGRTFRRVARMWATRSSTNRRLPHPTLPATSSNVPLSRPMASGTISLPPHAHARVRKHVQQGTAQDRMHHSA